MIATMNQRTHRAAEPPACQVGRKWVTGRPAAKGAILSSVDVRRKLRELDEIERVVGRCHGLSGLGPRHEGALSSSIVGAALSAIVSLCFVDGAGLAAQVWLAILLAAALVSLRRWRTLPRLWIQLLDQKLAAYYDPLDVQSYALLQWNTSAGGGLSLGAVNDWISLERGALEGLLRTPARVIRSTPSSCPVGASAPHAS